MPKPADLRGPLRRGGGAAAGSRRWVGESWHRTVFQQKDNVYMGPWESRTSASENIQDLLLGAPRESKLERGPGFVLGAAAPRCSLFL